MAKVKVDGKKNVLFLGIVSMLTDMGTEMIFPILPLFLSNVLGLSMAFIGLIDGVADATASIVKVFSGVVSDRLRKRKVVTLFGYGLSMISKPFYILGITGFQFLTVKFFDRLGKGFREAPRDALVAESVDKHEIGRAFGLQRALDFLGAALGSIIAFLLLTFVTKDFRLIFKLALIPVAIGVFVLFFFVRDSKIKVSHGKIRKLTWNTFNFDFKAFVFISTIFNLANFTFAMFILKSQELGIAPSLAPLVYLAFGATATLSSYIMGKFSDKVDKDKIIALGFILFALANLGMIFVSQINTLIIWPLIFIYGLQAGMLNSVSRAFIGELTPKDFKATAFGAYYTCTGLALLPAGIIAGTLWDMFSSNATFLYGACVGLLAAIMMLAFVFKIHDHKKTEPLLVSE